MDADDISLPDRLQRQTQFLDDHKRVALVGCQFARIDGEGRVVSHYTVPLRDRALRRALPVAECCFCHGAVMVRREALQQVGAYRPGKAEDVDLWLRLSERYHIANLPD